MDQLIPKELLEKSSKILFIDGIAIGDFSYLHNCFKALSEQYPNLKIDLWVDEYRGKSCLFRWKSKKHDIVYEWLESCSFFNKIYKNVGAWWNMPGFFKQLRQENYSIIVCALNARPKRTARFAKIIAPQSFIVTSTDSINTLKIAFIRDFFTYQFEKIFGINIPDSQKKLSFNIDKKWIDDARAKFLTWGIKEKQDKIIFLNSFAKIENRCWDIDSVIDLIKKIKQEELFSSETCSSEACSKLSFIINALPEKRELIEDIVKCNSLKHVHVFTASKSFFELPSIISLCDLVISVDTSVIHLANALNIPLVGLVRQKNAIWTPKSEKSSFIYTKNRREWTSDISVADVFEVVKESAKKICS